MTNEELDALMTGAIRREKALMPTPDEAVVLERLRRDLHAANYPATYRVDRETLETIEGYLQRMQQESVAAWRAVGEPEDWDRPLWWSYCGPHMGPMFKGVELIPA